MPSCLPSLVADVTLFTRTPGRWRLWYKAEDSSVHFSTAGGADHSAFAVRQMLSPFTVGLAVLHGNHPMLLHEGVTEPYCPVNDMATTTSDPSPSTTVVLFGGGGQGDLLIHALMVRRGLTTVVDLDAAYRDFSRTGPRVNKVLGEKHARSLPSCGR